jgi:hypothetical protein
MKKKLLTALAFLLILTATAYAGTTTHYSFTTPTVGASQNVWGTILNTSVNAIDTQLWTNVGGVSVSVNTQSSATSITLTNPLARSQQITFTAPSQSLILPVMNASSSMVVGGTLIIANAGSNAFSVKAQDTTTVIVSSIAPGQTLRLTLATVSANGTFTTEGPYLTTVGTLSLGTSTAGANPAISGDLTSGFYTPIGTTVAVAAGGVEVEQWNTAASGVNFFSVTPAATGSAPIIASAGADTNIGINLTPKGTGGVNINTTSALLLPIGTTGQRPTGVNGQIRYNSTLNAVETFQNSTWVSLGQGPTVTAELSGTGTYTTPAGVTWIEVRMVGGGGGGGSSGSTSGSGTTAGGTTTFGSSLLSAGGGQAGLTDSGLVSPSGGTGTINSPATGIALNGGNGCSNAFTGGGMNAGACGGSSAFGGAGGGAVNPTAGQPNTGGGGGGGGGGNIFNGSGGGAGGYVDAIINSPASTYSYAVGVGGTGETQGGSGNNGANGGSGGIWITEHYGP